MNLVLLWQEELAAATAEDGAVLLPADDRRAKHITKVLKPEAGATIRVGALGSGAGRAAVELVEGGAVRLTPEPGIGGAGAPGLWSLAFTPSPPPPRVDLLLAMPRPKAMMRMWAQLAQLGVRRIILTNAHRVEKPYFSSQATDPAKYMPEIVDGLEQACCTHVPDVRVEMRFKPFVEDTLDSLFPPDTLRLLCHPGEGCQRVGEAIAAAQAAGGASPAGVLLAVGPEGGWVDFEIELLLARHFKLVSLGTRILCTDTATVSLIALASDALAAADVRADLAQPSRPDET